MLLSNKWPMVEYYARVGKRSIKKSFIYDWWMSILVFDFGFLFSILAFATGEALTWRITLWWKTLFVWNRIPLSSITFKQQTFTELSKILIFFSVSKKYLENCCFKCFQIKIYQYNIYKIYNTNSIRISRFSRNNFFEVIEI